MRNVKVGVFVCGLMFMALASSALAQIQLPPPESAWNENRMVREDPRPLEIGGLTQRPVINGVIDPVEWAGATTYAVIDPIGGGFLGTVYAGWYNGTVFLANDWTVNVDPNPLNGAANAWRIGTALDSGPQNSGTGRWYEIYVNGTGGGGGGGMVRTAISEDELQYSGWQIDSFFDVFTELSFNTGIGNWQYELEIDRNPIIDPTPMYPDPGPLPICWHWEWRQIDPAPWDGRWVPVYDGTMHTPEPSTLISLVGMVLMGFLYVWRRRN